MPALSLRAKVLLASSLTLVSLIGATLAYVSVQANRFVTERLAGDLQRTQELIAAVRTDRFGSLLSVAQLLASFPEFRGLLGTDTATIRDFLNDYQGRSGRSDLLIVFDQAGQVLARTDAVTPVPVRDAQERWLRPTLAGQPATGLLETDTNLYEAAMAPAEAGGIVFGFLIAGTRIDDGWARRLRETTGDEIVALGDRGVLGSTIQATRLPWPSKPAWETFAGPRTGPLDVTITGEQYAALAAAPAPSVTVVALQSRDRALAPYRRIQFGLLILGLVGNVAGVCASAWLARTLTAPVARLTEGTRQVAAGNFDYTIDVASRDELGALAQSFNQMTRGLRERADMQKFMSQSTMEMIQAGPRKVSAGERRRLTVFFSDIRGFTVFADKRPPEEVVQILNRCLSLQANLVRKYGGDIDKYVGDAVMALFSGEDMALTAIRCAVDILKAMGSELRLPDGEPLPLGIGIVTGEVVLGSIGGGNRLDYTAIGANVNLSSRLCGMAAANEILMSESTYEEVRDLIAAERLESVQIKGLNTAIAVYRMLVKPSPQTVPPSDT
ncbi:MAG: adenylate/guanylate cyclase domain-containing protein [Acidobacteriota bacterium]